MASWWTESEKVILSGYVNLGLKLEMNYHKVPFLDLFCFWYMSVTKQMTLKTIARYLLGTDKFSMVQDVHISASGINKGFEFNGK